MHAPCLCARRVRAAAAWAAMSWDTRLSRWVQTKWERWQPSEPRRHEYFRWFYGDELDECVGSVFSRKNFPELDETTLEAKRLKWATLLRRNQKYGYHSTGNRVTVLEGGDCCYDEMLASIGAARERVWCESYIFDKSYVGETFFRALLAAAKRDCDVVLLVDYIGSFGLPMEWVSELQRAGAEVSFFNPVMPFNASVGPLSFRDHRKVLICDGVGFCGGMNIQKEVGEAKYGSSHFYDVHSKLEGPCVADLADVFRDSLLENGGRHSRDPMPRPPRIDGGIYVQILQSNVRQRRRTLQKVIARSINSADESLYITTAYFFPPGFLRRALMQVPARGASLSLLLSGSSDFYPVPGDLLAQTHFLRRFLSETRGYESQISVNLYGDRHMHAKHMSVDGVFSYIGSFNYDLYSARRNLEVGVAVFDQSFAQRLQSLHQTKVSESRRATLQDWWFQQPGAQLACAVAYGCIRLSGRNFFDGLDCFEQKWLVRKASLTYLLEEQAAQFVGMSMMWGLD